MHARMHTHTQVPETEKSAKMGGLPKCYHPGCGADLRCYHGGGGGKGGEWVLGSVFLLITAGESITISITTFI